MTDLHAHLLPSVDDGSASPEESRRMLEESLRQGVSLLCATPHFYPATDSPPAFLERRLEALLRIRPLIPQGLRLLCGAEVYYYDGISRSEALTEMTVEGSGVLLLEMPFERWSSRMLDEVCALADSRRVFPLLAHIDRYLAWQKRDVWYLLAEHGVGMQVNAEGILDRRTARRLEPLFMEGMVDALGSDMHNMTSRKPMLREAEDALRQRYGEEMLRDIEERSRKLVNCFGC